MAKSNNVKVAERLELDVPKGVQNQGFYGFISWLKGSPDATKLQFETKPVAKKKPAAKKKK